MQGSQPRQESALTGPMRWLFLTYCVTVSIAGIQLFIFSARTGDYFAWTIAPPQTAAFLGACYWGSLPMVLLAARAESWQRARIAFWGVLCFAIITLVVTTHHRDRFHFDASEWQPAAAAWAWLAIYVLVPVAAIAAFVWQRRHALPIEPGRPEPMRGPLRFFLAIEGVALLAYGAGLLLAPGEAADAWPWRLSPLTARAIGAWLAGMGLHGIHAALEGDRKRTSPLAWAHLLFAALQAVVLLRYAGDLDWNSPAIWCWSGFLAAVFAGGVGIIQAGRRSADPAVPALGHDAYPPAQR